MPYMPSVTALRCLDASARAGSFTQAARELHLTQSAVSHHILNLERQLGVKLFERDSGRLHLTETGNAYWQETRSALQQLKRATFDLLSRHQQARLSILVPPSFTHAWLMRRVSESFVPDNQDITLNLVNRTCVSESKYDDVDAAIELSDVQSPGIAVVRLLALEYSLYAAPALLLRLGLPNKLVGGTYPEAAVLRLLQSAALIRTSMSDAWPGWLKVNGFDDRIALARYSEGPQYSQASLALIGVLNGTGVALLPKHVANEHHEAGSLLRLGAAGWAATRSYQLQWPTGRPVAPALRRFADWAATVAESELE